MRRIKPQTYQDWLNELDLSAKRATGEDHATAMIKAARMAGKLNPNKKEARHDVALVLANIYRRETTGARGHMMVLKAIEKKFNKVSKALFKSRFKALLNYVISKEPSFDPQATAVNQGKTRPGNIKANASLDKEGRKRRPLGFLGATEPRVAEDGHIDYGLGFLGDDAPPSGSSLGFL
jgi:hypothetical protein